MLTSHTEAKKDYWLYLLELDGGYLYIGITSRPNPRIRINEHFLGKGAEWTKLHEPVRVLSLKKLGYMTKQEAEALEENATQRFMDIYGYNKIRGGSRNFSGNYVKFQEKYLQTNVLHSHWA